MCVRNQSLVLLGLATIIMACASPAKNKDTAFLRLVESESRNVPTAGPIIAESVHTLLESLGSDEFLPVVVRLRSKVNLRTVADIQDARNKDARRIAVIHELQEFAASEQRNLLVTVAALEADGLVKDVNPMWLANVICLKLKADAIDALVEFAEIEHIVPDADRALFLQEISWNVRHINSPDVWRRAAGDLSGNGVVVAVLDSGVDRNHADLKKRLWTNTAEDLDSDGQLTVADENGIDEDGNGYIDDVVGWDFDANDNDPGPRLFASDRAEGHGTHVAGIIAGDGSNGTATGVAPGAELMILKIGSQRSTWAAMEYALEKGADILNMSIGWPLTLAPDRATWRDMVENLTDAGVLVVAGSGNGGQAPMVHATVPRDISIPGSIPRALTVAAVGRPDEQDWLDPMAEFAPVGPTSWESVNGFQDYPYPPGLRKPDVTAPGINIMSTMPGGKYQVKSGTSMAVAHVSGVAAILLEQDPALLPHELLFRIRESAWRFTDPNNVRGWGRIDALSAANYQGEPVNYDLAIETQNPQWQSHDIWVDNDGDGNPDLPVPGMTNRVYVRVQNLGGQPVGNAELRFYFANAGTLARTTVESTQAPGINPAFEYIGSYNIPVIGPAGSSQASVIGAVNWHPPDSNEGIQHWSLAAAIVSPDPPNAAEAYHGNNYAVDNDFHLKVAPGAESTFSFYLHGDPGRLHEPFNLEVIRQGLPMDFDIRLSIEDAATLGQMEKMRGFERVENTRIDDFFPLEFLGQIDKGMRLLGNRGVLEEITLSGGQPVLAKLMIKAPEIDSDLWLQPNHSQNQLVLNTENDYGTFGGLSLQLDFDEDAGQIRKIIYVQK